MSEQIVNIDSKFEIAVKRFYIPFTLVAKCPECGKDKVSDLSEDYLSYPTLNQKESMYFYCDDCSCEFEVGIFVGMNIKYDLNKIKKL